MAILADLSLELIDHILFALDPLDIAGISQTSRFFHEVVYGLHSRQFWRGLYLAQPLDDPRRTVNYLGRLRDDDVHWKEELQRITRARTVVKRPTLCRHEERCQVLRTCIDLITNMTPISSPTCSAREMSLNVRWMQRLLKDGTFLDAESWNELSEEEEQLLSRLHALYGMTHRDFDLGRRRASQAFVYSLRHSTAQRSYGPFTSDGSMCVDWRYIWKLMHDLAMLLVDMDDEDVETSYVCPLSLLFSQNVIPRGLNLDSEDDWAGMEGLWSVRYGFMDHREFLRKSLFHWIEFVTDQSTILRLPVYNDPSVPEDEPQDTTIFEGTQESLASLDIYVRVAGVEPDPSHPSHPKINIVGEVDGLLNIYGFVKLTADNQVWWHYVGGNDSQMVVWQCDAIGLGGIRSQRGFIGAWSTAFHDVDDPIGAFWMHRELADEE